MKQPAALHHAFPTYSSSFRQLNDLYSAAKHLMRTQPMSSRRILIVDLDVHKIWFYDSRVSPHSEDESGRLRLSDEGLHQRDLYVLATLIKKGILMATVIGGGYFRDIDRLPLRHSIIHRAAKKGELAEFTVEYRGNNL
ncbi:hypothetical protein DNTS_005980 [Danionella cerebrum]|uniref:Uncharacterized protein n=1 Tax=Danionella cerebrum TaxID=2873325 RepID=A0A553QCC8_9TELE|nr:hypothetical protein DNTS_005980 [Danionella translucida]